MGIDAGEMEGKEEFKSWKRRGKHDQRLGIHRQFKVSTEEYKCHETSPEWFKYGDMNREIKNVIAVEKKQILHTKAIVSNVWYTIDDATCRLCKVKQANITYLKAVKW